MASLVRGIFVGQLSPLRSCPQYPQDAIQHGTGISPGTPSPIFASCRLQNRFQDGPLRIAYFPASTHRISELPELPSICPNFALNTKRKPGITIYETGSSFPDNGMWVRPAGDLPLPSRPLIHVRRIQIF